VAQLFRVPPYMLGAEIGSSLTYSTTEGQGIDFVRWCLGRWLTRIENAIGRDADMFPPSLGLFPEFLTDAILRASTKERYEAYSLGIRDGHLLRSEARQMENRPAIEGIDAQPLPAPAAAPKTSSASSNGHVAEEVLI
jgi:phage portal protein BeeE